MDATHTQIIAMSGSRILQVVVLLALYVLSLILLRETGFFQASEQRMTQDKPSQEQDAKLVEDISQKLAKLLDQRSGRDDSNALRSIASLLEKQAETNQLIVKRMEQLETSFQSSQQQQQLAQMKEAQLRANNQALVLAKLSSMLQENSAAEDNSLPPPPPPLSDSSTPAPTAYVYPKIKLLNKMPVEGNKPSPSDRITELSANPLYRLHARNELQEKYGIKVRGSSSRSKPLYTHFYDPIKYPYRHLIPLHDNVALALSKHYNETYALGIEFGLPAPLLEMVISKDRFHAFLSQDLGLNEYVPRIYANREEFYAHDGGIFPVMVKEYISTGSSGAHVAKTAAMLDDFYSRQNFTFFLQEYVSGREERIIHVAAIRGRLVRMICHTRTLMQSIYHYSEIWRATPPQIDNELCLPQVVAKIIEALHFTGIGNFDTRVNRNGEVKILEFNARVASTIHRDARLFGELFCALQWNGNGILSPTGCEYTEDAMETRM